MKLLKSDKVIIGFIICFVIFIIICIHLNSFPNNLDSNQKNKLIINLQNIKKNGNLSNLNNLSNIPQVNSLTKVENFRMPYDSKYVDPFMFYAEVSMEFDPDDITEGPIPSIAPIISEAVKLDNLEKEKEKEKDMEKTISKDEVIAGVPGISEINNGVTTQNQVAAQNTNKLLKAYEEDTPEFYIPCKPVAVVADDGYTHKYSFAKNSALLGTFYENLFNQKCTDYYENRKKEQKMSVNKLQTLNLPSYQISQLQDIVSELEYNLTDEDMAELEDIIQGNPPQLEKKLKNLLTKKGKQAQDLDNMYLTKESAKGENRVDTIQSIANNEEEDEEGKDKLVMCLKRYRGDEDRCFPPKKFDKKTFCPISECYSPLLVVGSCTINGDDTEPYLFEVNAHFVIKKHPKNPERRIIYLNIEDEARRCESDPAFFTNYLEIKKTERFIELIQNEISLMMTNEVKLTAEQKKEYEELEEKIKKLKDDLGNIKPAPGESRVDRHGVSKEINDKITDTTYRYNNFKKVIRDELIAEKEKEKKVLEDKLKKQQDSLSGKNNSTVSKKICLKYNYQGSTLLPKLLYEDDRRNLLKGYKSDWFIQKYFNEEGEDTGFYKIRAEIGGTKFNLSKKPKPLDIGFLGFNLPIIESKPKVEDQLWMIKEVGDLNAEIELGETKEETDIKGIGKDKDEAIKNKNIPPP